jgi:polysaccharide pyruvyl transferase WcaK-like protein/MoaA/NifB/PqqE/SkfB family radical SAM enzyme
MCNVWKDKKSDNFNPKTISKTFSDSFFSKVRHLGISGGEPTLNPNLIENIKAIVNLLNLKTLSMTSHGFHTDKHKVLLPMIKEMCDDKKISFSLNISLDGIDDVHIKIRRIKDAFAKATSTAFYAKSLGIPVQFQTTVSRDNVYNVVKVREYAIENGFESIFRIATEISRLYNEDVQERISLDDKQKSFFADFLRSERTIFASKSLGRRLFYSDLSRRLITGGDRIAPCSFQSTGLFLSPVGKIYNCSISNIPLKVNSNDFHKSIKSDENSKILTNLIKNKCNDCLHDQSGRWKIYHYLKVHQKSRKYYLLLSKYLVFLNVYLRNILIKFKPKTSSKKKSQKKALIIGMYGGEHVGDAAILGGVILRIKKTNNINDFDVLSIRKDRTECWVNNLNIDSEVKVLDHNQKLNIHEYDLLILAGGPIMDIPIILMNHLYVINKFKKYNKPFIIEGVGYGPLKTKFGVKLARKIINKSDKISLRTDSDYLKVSRFKEKSYRTEDPAFDYLQHHLKCLITSTDKSLGKILTVDKKICVINLRPLDKSYMHTLDSIMENNLIDSIVFFMNHKKEEYHFVFMPMNSDQFGYCDLLLAYKIEKEIKHKEFKINYHIWETEPTINDSLLLLKKASLAISMRFHGCIFAMAADVPTIGIDYSTIEKGKVFNLFKNFGKEKYVTNINDIKKNTITDIAKSLI